MILADLIPIIHRIKRRNLIHPHRRHLQNPRHLIHDTQATEACLSLSEIEQWHHGRFLVLWWVARQDLLDDGLVGGGEGEGD